MSLRAVVCLNLITLVCFLSTLLYISFPNMFIPRLDGILIKINKKGNKTDEMVVKGMSATETAAIQMPLNNTSSDNTYGAAKNYTFGDLQKSVCIYRFKPAENTVYHDEKKSCPTKGIVTNRPVGRTGNQMWEYSAIWSIARDNGLEPYLPMCLKLKLEEVFDDIPLPTLESIADCPFDYDSVVYSVDKLSPTKPNLILPRSKFYIEKSRPHLAEIVTQFKFKKKIADYSHQILSDLVSKLPPKNYTFIGVHVRRTDYVDYLKTKYHSEPATARYFQNAMNYYKSRFSNCLFIYVSDDPVWCFKQFGNLKDVFVPSYNTNSSAGNDLAVMANCNHTIFDYGTFGEWGAILAGGRTVLYKSIRNQQRETQYIKNWIMMK